MRIGHRPRVLAERKLAPVRYCAALSLLLLALFSLGQSGTKQEAAAQHKSEATQITQPAVSPVPEQPVPAEQKYKSEQQPPKCPLPEWTDPFWSNWALVLITGFAVWYAKRTLDDLKEQTQLTKTAADAAKISADAAKLNAQAIINSERAWISGIVAETDRVDLFGHPAHIPICEIGIRNAGRTPGKIITLCFRFEKIGDLAELPPEPYFGIDSIRGLGGHIVFPEETAVWVNIEIEGEQPLSAQERAAVKEQTLFLLCWGEINYEDVITKQPHVSRFCYRYGFKTSGRQSGFETWFAAPPPYREAT